MTPPTTTTPPAPVETPVTKEFVLDRIRASFAELTLGLNRLKTDLIEPGEEHPREGTDANLLRCWDRMDESAKSLRKAAWEIDTGDWLERDTARDRGGTCTRRGQVTRR